MRKFDFKEYMEWVEYKAGEGKKPLTSLDRAAHLSRIEGEEFIMFAYKYIFKREAETDAFNHYSRHAGSLPGRLRICCSLLFSDECEILPPKIKRLKNILKRRQRKG